MSAQLVRLRNRYMIIRIISLVNLRNIQLYTTIYGRTSVNYDSITKLKT